MNTLLFLIAFIGLGIIYFIIGMFASRNITNLTDYFLAGRGLGILPVTATVIATQIGGGMLIGTAEKAYYHGIYGIFYTLGMSIGLLLLSTGIAGKLQALNIHSIAEVFEVCYGSTRLKILGSVLSIITFSGILIGQIVALKSLLIGLGFTNPLVFASFWTFILAYTIVGGLSAVVATDMIQVAIIVLVFSGIFIVNLLQEPASFFTWQSLVDFQGQFKSITVTPLKMLPIVIAPALFSLIQQDLAQRFFASKTKAVATTSAFISGIFLLLFSLIPIYFGMKARIFGLSEESAFTKYLEYTTNEYVMIFAICALIAAITSTADSLLNSISLHIAKDLEFLHPTTNNKLVDAQLSTLGVGVITFIGSYLVPQDVINILIASYEISISALFIPIFISYFKKRLYVEAAWGGIIGGMIGFIVFNFFLNVPYELPREVLSLGLSSVGYVLGEMLAKSRL